MTCLSRSILDLVNNQKEMPKKKILIFTPSLEVGGSEIVLVNFISPLADLATLKIVTFCSGALIPIVDNRIEVKVIANRTNFFFKTWNFIFRRLTGQTILEKQIRAVEQEFASDIWLINTVTLPNVVAIASKLNKKAFLFAHELIQIFGRLSNSEIKQVAYFPTKILCCSNAVKNMFQILNRTENISVVYPGIDIEFYRNLQDKKIENIPNDAFIWAMTGNIDENKDPIFFLNLAKILLTQHKKAYMVWFGNINYDGGLFFYCTKLVQKFQIEDRVIWAGNTKDSYTAYFKNIDAFVLTSSYESFSMVTLEAITMGKPVVTYNSGGVQEILGPEYPLAKAKTIGDYTQLMNEIMNNREFYTKLSHLGLARASSFSQSKQQKKFLTELLA